MSSKKDIVAAIKKSLASMPRFKSKCFVCGVSDHKKGMVFHHLWYDPKEPDYSDFADSYDYHLYLEEYVRNNPKQFLYVCNPHHQAITRLKRYNQKTLKRLLMAVRRTR